MAVAGRRTSGPLDINSTATLSGSNVLLAKPFNPKGSVPLPNVNVDMLQQKLAALSARNMATEGTSTTGSVEKNPFKQPIKAPVKLPPKPCRTTETAKEPCEQRVPIDSDRNTSDSEDTQITGLRPKSGSVRNNVSLFENNTTKTTPKVPGKPGPRVSLKKPQVPVPSTGRDNICPADDRHQTPNDPVPTTVAAKPIPPKRPQRSTKEHKATFDQKVEQPKPTCVPSDNLAPSFPVKPQNIAMPAYPSDLNAWIRQYVLTNSLLSSLVTSTECWQVTKTEAASSECHLGTQHPTDSEDIYDDVSQGGAQKELIYDDASNITSDDDMASSNPTYEVDDDVSPPPRRKNEGDGDQDKNNSSTAESAQDQMLYEPVENVEAILALAENMDESEETSKDKKREEKERREREKKEKKEKERMEKEKKKEEEERKRKEREEKKRKAKERKMFGLKVDEELNIIERHFAKKDYKGKEKELTYAINDCIEIVSKENCPKGKWLAQNPDKKLGYILLSEFSIASAQDAPSLPPRIPTEDELEEGGELYEVINVPIGNGSPPELPPERVIPVAAVQEEEIYDDIGAGETNDGMDEEEEENLYQVMPM